MEATDHERVVSHRPRVLEDLVQLGIVLVDAAAEARHDQLVAGLVELPPRPFEVEHGALSRRQRSGLLGRSVHGDSLTRGRVETEDGHRRTARQGRSLALPTVTLGPRPFLIGVAGGSSSGKTTVAERLAELAGDEHLALIKLDSYYVAFDGTPIEERRAFNYDHPDAFDWPLLNDHLAALAAGAPVPVPVYDYVDFNRTGAVRIVHPAQIVVVEGILVLWEATLRDRFDLKVFLDTDADLRFIRRLQRDVAARGRSADSVIDQYLATVRPAHEQFIEPSKRYADVIIPNGGLNRPALDVLLARVRELAV